MAQNRIRYIHRYTCIRFIHCVYIYNTINIQGQDTNLMELVDFVLRGLHGFLMIVSHCKTLHFEIT